MRELIILTPQEIKHIENIIQYEFKNKKLLEEAFIIYPEADDLTFSSEIFRKIFSLVKMTFCHNKPMSMSQMTNKFRVDIIL